jgi:hypothetical protein
MTVIYIFTFCKGSAKDPAQGFLLVPKLKGCPKLSVLWALADLFAKILGTQSC